MTSPIESSLTAVVRNSFLDSVHNSARGKILILLLTLLAGCVHRIHVNPLPVSPTSTTIPRSLQVAIGPLSLEGADHMPGIPLLEWSHRDLSQALIRYVQKRNTFNSVSTNPADLSLDVTTKLALTSRQNRYHYRVRLEAEMSEASRLIKAYLVEHVAVGSAVRWVTASDRDPIEAAFGSALDDLLTQIETDRSLYTRAYEPPAE